MGDVVTLVEKAQKEVRGTLGCVNDTLIRVFFMRYYIMLLTYV